MIFRAFALTVFSFAGMANEIEEKKVEKINKEEKLESSCIEKYLADFERLEKAGVTFEWAGAIAFNNYKKCKDKEIN